MIGVPPHGSSGLGMFSVKGRRQVARPAARIMAFTVCLLLDTLNISKSPPGRQPQVATPDRLAFPLAAVRLVHWQNAPFQLSLVELVQNLCRGRLPA